MNIKELKELKTRKALIETEIQEQRDAFAVRSPSLSSEGGGRSDRDQRLAYMVTNIQELEKELETVERRISAITSAIISMPEPYNQILYYRLVKNWHWDRIARKISYSEAQTYRLRKEAIRIFKEK